MESKTTLWYRFVRFLCRRVIFSLTGGVSAAGLENIPLHGPVIFAPVHMSNCDPPLIGGLIPRSLRTMAKEELFKFPMNLLMQSIGTFPIKRGEGDMAPIRLCIQQLKAGNALMIFPEGSRNDGHTMLPLQSGLGMIAKKTGALVIPVGSHGSQIVLGRGAKRMRKHHCRVVFGTPFRYGDQPAVEGLDERASFNHFLAHKIAEASALAGNPIKAFETNSSLKTAATLGSKPAES